MALHGWIILDKPLGKGSTTCVGWVKRALREAGEPKTRVGHGGTLDPLATGVLPIAVGEATKLAGHMLDATKAYDFTIEFGSQTDTLDLEGKVIATSEHRPTVAEVEAILPCFTGPIEQVPPAYSALKVDGKRAYALARAGDEVVLKTRAVTVFELQILRGTGRGTAEHLLGGGGVGATLASLAPLHHAAHGPPPRSGEELQSITLSATVSKGTYIRSLARDVALALGTVGHVTMLRRTKAGPFTLEQAISLDFLDEAAKARALTRTVLPLTAGLDDIPALPVTPDDARLLRVGQRLVGNPALPGLYLATDATRPVALVEVAAGDVKVVRGFNV
jgi:tRNA pseudouridine55 synthase